MTLDEAIAHAREVAEEQRKACDLAWIWDNPDNIKKCAEEHDQLAEWLEELKAIKEEIGTDEWIMEHDRLIRNGAIDDFAKWLENKKYLMKEIQERDFCYTHYDELKANCVTTEYFEEQLKVGDKNAD